MHFNSAIGITFPTECAKVPQCNRSALLNQALNRLIILPSYSNLGENGNIRVVVLRIKESGLSKSYR